MCLFFLHSRYNEVCDYDFNTHKSTGGAVGHFTQVVWKGSNELGMGKASKGDCTYVVGRYKPPGNYIGKEPENVFKGTYNKEATCSGGGAGGGGAGGGGAGAGGQGGGQGGGGQGGGGQGGGGQGGGGQGGGGQGGGQGEYIPQIGKYI